MFFRTLHKPVLITKYYRVHHDYKCMQNTLDFFCNLFGWTIGSAGDTNSFGAASSILLISSEFTMGIVLLSWKSVSFKKSVSYKI